MTQWVAFVGGAWLWGGKDEDILGDMVGPFPTWSDAATYLIEHWPLLAGLDEPTDEQKTAARETIADLVRPLDPPDAWVAIPLDSPASVDVAVDVAKTELVRGVGREDQLAAEIRDFWSTHEVT